MVFDPFFMPISSSLFQSVTQTRPTPIKEYCVDGSTVLLSSEVAVYVGSSTLIVKSPFLEIRALRTAQIRPEASGRGRDQGYR